MEGIIFVNDFLKKEGIKREDVPQETGGVLRRVQSFKHLLLLVRP